MSKTEESHQESDAFEGPTIVNTPSAASMKSELQVHSREQLEIINWLKEVRFRKKMIGGLDEQDVWRKIQQLNEMYETALKAERIRYDVLLEEQSKNRNPGIEIRQPIKEPTIDE